jgi:DNA-binding transcriptional LysR family regulator
MRKFDGGENMDIRKFEIFLDTIDSGSLTKTAQALGYTQSAISHTINSLESEFNLQLLTRSRAGVSLTSEGRALLPYIRNTVTSFQEFRNKVAEIHNLDYGSIRIGTFTSTAVHWLPGILSSFRDLYPSIQFEVKYGNYAEIAEWILQGRIDCGFTIAPEISGIRHVPLKKDRFLVIYPPGHPLSLLKKINPSDVANYPYILVIEGDDPIIRNFFTDNDIHLNIQYRVVDDYAAVAMVESGLGITVTPELFFYRLAFNVDHRALNTPFRRQLAISYKDHFTVSPVVTRFIAHVQNWAADNAYPFDE